MERRRDAGASGNEDECRIPGLLDEFFSLFYDTTHLFEPYTSCFLSEVDNDDFGPAVATIPFDRRGNGDKADHDTTGAAAAATTTITEMEFNDDDNDMDTALIPVGLTFENDEYLYVTTR